MNTTKVSTTKPDREAQTEHDIKKLKKLKLKQNPQKPLKLHFIYFTSLIKPTCKLLAERPQLGVEPPCANQPLHRAAFNARYTASR